MNQFDYKGWVYGNLVEEVPESSSSKGDKGQFCFDENYFYVCVDTDTWKRIALATW